MEVEAVRPLARFPRMRSVGGPRRYVSASELAEYAYCPRAHFYRAHPDGRPVAAASSVSAAAGVRYHAQTARSERRWSESSALPWIVATLVGAALLLAVVGGSIP